MEDQHVFDLLPEYALAMLEDAERQQVETHLLVCPVCQQELAGYQAVVADLPAGMKMASPSPALKGRIQTAIREPAYIDRQVASSTFWERIKAAYANRLPLWGAVSFVLVLVLALSNIFLWQSAVRNNLNRQAMVTVALNHTDSAPDASGLLVMDHAGEYGVLVVDGLPALNQTQQYQLWLIQDGERTNGGVFSVNDHGYGSLSVASPQSLLDYSSFGITVEPAGGSPGPTGTKVLGGEF